MPYLQMYVATKAFAEHFSYGLYNELSGYVDVVAVRPFGLNEESPEQVNNELFGHEYYKSFVEVTP